MGWLKMKNGPIAVVLLLSALLFSSVESKNYDCDLNSSKADTIAVSLGETFDYLNVLNLNNPKATIKACSWNISQPVGNYVFELSRVVLAPTDSLEVVGYHVGDKTKNASSISLYSSKGSSLPGLISTQNFDWVIVNLKLSNDALSRTYTTVFYWKPDPVLLSKESGLLAFPLNVNGSGTISSVFTLQPNSDYSDRIVLLNFTQLPQTYSFTVNGAAYSEKNPPIAILQPNASTPLKIEFKDFKPDIITTQYWLVSADCSGAYSLKTGEQRNISIPNEASRKQQQTSNVKCAQIFTSPDKTKFQLLLDPKQDGLANTGDSITIYKPDGTIEINLNAPALMYFRTIDNYLFGNKFLVVYDSPFASNTNLNYIPPTLKVISEVDAGVVMLTDKEQTIQITGDGKTPASITHVLYPSDLASSKRIVIQFEDVTLLPDQMSISVYNSEDNSASPLVTLGKFDRLPSAISTGSSSGRVVFSGKVQSLKVTYKLVDSSAACQSLSTVTPTFEVTGGAQSSICSWYLPQANPKPAINYTVINPTILKIPQGKVLTVTTFSAKTTSVQYQGPIYEFSSPDTIWGNENAYQFSIDTSNTTKDNLHLLFVQKNNYFVQTIQHLSTEKVSSIKSINYPGDYPVGFEQNWAFNSTDAKSTELALVTVEDLQLKANHHLTLVAQPVATDFTSDTKLADVPDYLLRYPFVFSLNSKTYNLTSLSSRGFTVGLKYPGISGDISVSKDKESQIIFSSASNVTSNPLNIWRVTADDKSKLLSGSILRINVTLAEGLDKTKAKLNIYDSISLRGQSIHLANGSISGTSGFYLGSIKSAIIVYDYADSLTSKANFSVSFTVSVEECKAPKNFSVAKCRTTDRCITELMACNGIDECGDNTDELFIYCNGNSPQPPTPPAPASSGGVNTLVVIFVLMPLSAVLGIIGYIYLPQFLTRIRRGRYSEFRDLSEVS